MGNDEINYGKGQDGKQREKHTDGETVKTEEDKVFDFQHMLLYKR